MPQQILPFSIFHSDGQVLLCQKAYFELNNVRVHEHAMVDDFTLHIFIDSVLVASNKLNGDM